MKKLHACSAAALFAVNAVLWVGCKAPAEEETPSAAIAETGMAVSRFDIVQSLKSGQVSLNQASSGGKLKIAYLVDGLFNDSSQRHWQQVQNEAAMRGWDLVFDTNVSGNYEADPTRNAFQNMVSQSPDAIVISYLDIPPIADLIDEAFKRGIGVYCIGTDLSPGILLNVASDNSVIGAKVMSYVLDRLGGSADVMGFQNLWMTRGIRRDEIAFTMAESQTYDVNETISHYITPEGFTDEMYNTATNWLTKYGSRIDFIWAAWDGGGITIAQAMAALGYDQEDMFTVGMDGGRQSWAYIRSGEIPFVASLAEPFEYQVHLVFEGIEDMQVDGLLPGTPGCIVPVTGNLSTDHMTVMIDQYNVPAVGSNIHALFNFYGGKSDDPAAWYNRGEIYRVSDYTE